MKYGIIPKLIAIFLCAVMLLTAAASGLSILMLAAMNINNADALENAYQQNMEDEWRWTAQGLVTRYAAQYLGGCPESLVHRIYGSRPFGSNFRAEWIYYTISEPDGPVLYGNYGGQSYDTCQTIPVSGAVYYKMTRGAFYAQDYESAYEMIFGRDETEEEAVEAPREDIALASGTEAALWESAAAESDVELFSGYENHEVYYALSHAIAPDYVVTFYMVRGAMVQDVAWELLRLAWNYRNWLMAVLGISLALFALLVVYLCCAAGRSNGSEEVRAGGLNRLPLDLYFALLVTVVTVVCFLILEGYSYLFAQGTAVTASACAYGGFVCCLAFVGFCFAFVAQLKTPGWFWVRNSLCVRCLGVCLRVGKWGWGLFLRICRGLPRCVKQIWFVFCGLMVYFWGIIHGILTWIGRRLKKAFAVADRFYRMLPMTWQWLLAGGGMILILVLGFAHGRARSILTAIALCGGMVVYGANSFGTLLQSTKRMRSGDLEAQVDDRALMGAFREFAEELNGLAGVAVVAAQKELRSERMKTELITNVSHDIKTPLTSIINYVDLLQKPHTPEQEQQYLEILARQSGRMKKLIEDLIEMSKASTGNMPVEITRINAVEAVNQALGEFSDKMDTADLTVVLRHPQEDLYIHADGRLMWRAMSNVLSNVVKYAMPGTRVYVDVSSMNKKVSISVKNVSRDQLNISADELMERFVRGDSSRNTEGSGLGLNIAQSLMQLQHGELNLLVDGDLFKATMVYPMAGNE